MPAIMTEARKKLAAALSTDIVKGFYDKWDEKEAKAKNIPPTCKFCGATGRRDQINNARTHLVTKHEAQLISFLGGDGTLKEPAGSKKRGNFFLPSASKDFHVQASTSSLRDEPRKLNSHEEEEADVDEPADISTDNLDDDLAPVARKKSKIAIISSDEDQGSEGEAGEESVHSGQLKLNMHGGKQPAARPSDFVKKRQVTILEALEAASLMPRDKRLDQLSRSLVKFLCRSGCPLGSVGNKTLKAFISTNMPLLGPSSCPSSERLNDTLILMAQELKMAVHNVLDKKEHFCIDLQLQPISDSQALVACFGYFTISSKICHAMITSFVVDWPEPHPETIKNFLMENFLMEDHDTTKVSGVMCQNDFKPFFKSVLEDMFPNTPKVFSAEDIIMDLDQIVKRDPNVKEVKKQLDELSSFLRNNYDLVSNIETISNKAFESLKMYAVRKFVNAIPHFKAFLCLKSSVQNVICDPSCFGKTGINLETIVIAKEIVAITTELDNFVEKVRGTEQLLCSQLYAHLQIFKFKLEILNANSVGGKSLKSQMLRTISNILSEMHKNCIYTNSQLIDPRYKKTFLVNTPFLTACKKNLVNELCAVNLEEEDPNEVLTTSESAVEKVDKLTSAMSDLQRYVAMKRTGNILSKEETMSTKLDLFLGANSKVMEEKTDVLIFWQKRMQGSDREMAFLAQKYLSIPGNSFFYLKDVTHSNKLELEPNYHEFVFVGSLSDEIHQLILN